MCVNADALFYKVQKYVREMWGSKWGSRTKFETISGNKQRKRLLSNILKSL